MFESMRTYTSPIRSLKEKKLMWYAASDVALMLGEDADSYNFRGMCRYLNRATEARPIKYGDTSRWMMTAEGIRQFLVSNSRFTSMAEKDGLSREEYNRLVDEVVERVVSYPNLVDFYEGTKNIISRGRKAMKADTSEEAPAASCKLDDVVRQVLDAVGGTHADDVDDDEKILLEMVRTAASWYCEGRIGPRALLHVMRDIALRRNGGE